LAISDFTIINVQGNLDGQTEGIVKICLDKMETLNNNKRSEIVIVENQSNTK
jgi:hypothetical protein